MSDGTVVAGLAVSLDGYVADSTGGVGFLDKYSIEEFDFASWVGRMGALIMGSTTYLQSLQWDWLWGDRPTMVLTTRSGLSVPDGANVAFSSEPTVEAIRSFAASTPKRLWVFGGGRVVTEGLRGGVIDELDLVVMPEALGDGIPLFAEAYDGPMRLIECAPYSNGAVRLVYDTRPISEGWVDDPLGGADSRRSG